MILSEQTLLALIKCTLFNIPIEYGITLVDWNSVLDEAKVQSVVGLAEASVPAQFKSIWVKAQSKVLADYVRNLKAQDELLSLLASYYIPVVILKGTAAAIFYPKPSQRSMGDIDFVVPQGLFNKTRAVLETNGYTIVHEREEEVERHVGYKKGDAILELHHHFSHVDLDIESYIINGFTHLEEGFIDGYRFPMLPTIVNGLVLLAHMRSHLRSGLGLRQVIDWMMFVNRELDDELWNNQFQGIVESLGLDQLAITATRMCQIYLGLSESITWCKEADEKLCDNLMSSLLSSGNFGRKNERGANVETVATAVRRQGLLKYLQIAGEYNWKAYHKHRWLKPFCWIYQIGRYGRQGISANRGEKLKDDLERSKNRYEMLKELGIL